VLVFLGFHRPRRRALLATVLCDLTRVGPPRLTGRAVLGDERW
jgi:hypothetical protein